MSVSVLVCSAHKASVGHIGIMLHSACQRIRGSATRYCEALNVAVVLMLNANRLHVVISSMSMLWLLVL